MDRSGASVVTRTSNVLEFGKCSPGRIGRISAEEWQARLFKAQRSALSDRRVSMGGKAEVNWCHQSVQDLVHASKTDGRLRALAVQLLAGTVPTADGCMLTGGNTAVDVDVGR